MKVREILEVCEPVWIPNKKENTSAPFFSVLLPTYRRAKSGLFEKCICSVLNQTFSDLELIIIDDASADGTKDIIAEYMEKDSRVQCIRHTNNVGLPAISEYEGFMKSHGSYIAFIFDDCEWEKDYLEKIYDFSEEHPNFGCCYSRIKSYYGQGEDDYVVLGQSSESVGTHLLPMLNYIGNAGVVLSREVILDKRCGLYDPHLSQTRLCDWSLWKRISRTYNLFETGIECGCERGVSTKDSLGGVL